MKEMVKKLFGLENYDYNEEDILKKARSSDWKDRVYAARVSNKHLDELKNDEYFAVRYQVALRGHAPEELSEDAHWMVRKGVVESGNCLHKFMNDSYWKVRLALVGQGFLLERLVDDENLEVRKEAARLLGSKTYTISKNFGTYKGVLNLRVWSDKYEIQSGCYRATTLDEWAKKCEQRIDRETARRYKKIMKDIIYK